MVLTNGHHTCSSADCAAALCCNSCKEDCAALWGKPGIPGRDKRPGKTAFPGVCSPEVKLKEIKTWLLLGTIVSNVNLSFALYKLVSIQMRGATLFLSFTKASRSLVSTYLEIFMHIQTKTVWNTVYLRGNSEVFITLVVPTLHAQKLYRQILMLSISLKHRNI